MILRRVWSACGWCTRQGFRLSLWTTWLVLIVALAAQAHLISARRVAVPEPLQRLVEESARRQGLHVEFGRARMNLKGRFVLEDVRIGPAATRGTFATARTVYLDFNPWELLAGRLRLREMRLGDLNFHNPEAASDDETPPAHNIDLGLRLRAHEFELSHFTGYLGHIPVQASGVIAPPASRSSDAPRVRAEEVFAHYEQIVAAFREISPKLAAVDAPRVRLRFTPSAIDIDLRADRVDLTALAPEAGGSVEGVSVAASLPLSKDGSASVTIDAKIDSARLAGPTELNDLRLRLRGDLAAGRRVEPRSLHVHLGSARWREIDAGPVAATLVPVSPDSFRADVSFGLAGSAWRLQADAEPRAGAARLVLDGFVGDATLDFVGRRIDRDLAAILDPDVAAPLHVDAVFAPGWKLSRVSGRLHSGTVLVGGALLDETGAEFTYDGERVLCENLVLRQGESLAIGSYEMDTRTSDFRFLLTGRLLPSGIQSWFHRWWSDFWETFDFSRALPSADVDVRGRWGDLTATRVFVHAEGVGTGIKGVRFDSVRTRLFLRPHWFDILHFHVTKDSRTAAGRFSRLLDLQKDTWSHMEFDVESHLPLPTIVALFKEESAELLAPYDFTVPPRLRLSGRVDSSASPVGKKEHIDIALTSTGPLTFHDFPLSDLTFDARLRDDRIDLPVLAVGFAEGTATGTAHLWGPDDARRLAFDIALADANLGKVIQAVSRLQPSNAPEPEKTSEAARQRQQRLEEGRLVFKLEAEGAFTDFLSFKGEGRAAITGAELAQLNLFGPLSELLSGTHFNFGSFSLTTVDAPFVLEGERMHFDNLRVSGPSALIQAKGDYRLRDSRLDFTTKIYPFDESASVVGNALGFVLSPLSKVFEVKLQGTLAKPKWVFSYGPSRLLNTLTGTGESSSATTSSPEPATSADDTGPTR